MQANDFTGRVIRKLSDKEAYMSMLDEFDILIGKVFVSSKIDLFKSKQVVEVAIAEWKRINPFLRCTLERLSASDIRFVYADEQKQNDSFHNVEFLKFNGLDDASNIDLDLVELLVENERRLLFDTNEKSLLWRLKIFKLADQSAETNIFKYAFIYAVHHIIVESKYKHLSLLQLLDIIEDIYSDEYKPKNQMLIFPSADELFDLKRNEKLTIHDVQFPRRPKFIDTVKAKQMSINNKYFQVNINDKLKREYILRDNNERFMLVNDLIEYSLINNSKSLCLKYENFNVLIDKCKEYDIKLNGFLNMVILLGLRDMYNHFDSSTKANRFHYFNSVSLRQYVQGVDEKLYQPFAYLVTSMSKSFELPLTLNECLANFWQLAQQESKNFHKRLENGEQFFSWKWCELAYQEPEQMLYDYFCANLGRLPSSLKQHDSKKLIRIYESYEKLDTNECTAVGCFAVIASTIDDDLFMAIMFNSHFISYECIEYLKDSILKILDKLNFL